MRTLAFALLLALPFLASANGVATPAGIVLEVSPWENGYIYIRTTSTHATCVPSDPGRFYWHTSHPQSAYFYALALSANLSGQSFVVWVDPALPCHGGAHGGVSFQLVP